MLYTATGIGIVFQTRPEEHHRSRSTPRCSSSGWKDDRCRAESAYLVIDVALSATVLHIAVLSQMTERSIIASMACGLSVPCSLSLCCSHSSRRSPGLSVSVILLALFLGSGVQLLRARKRDARRSPPAESYDLESGALYGKGCCAVQCPGSPMPIIVSRASFLEFPGSSPLRSSPSFRVRHCTRFSQSERDFFWLVFEVES